MKIPIYCLCAISLVVALTVERISGEVEDNSNYFGRFLDPIDVAADQETISYLLPKLAAKYKPNNEWSAVTDPRFYLLTEMETSTNDINHQGSSFMPPLPESSSSSLQDRNKRIRDGGHSLSFVNSLDVLRNRLIMEIARKKAKVGANRNRQILLTLGKRTKSSIHRYQQPEDSN